MAREMRTPAEERAIAAINSETVRNNKLQPLIPERLKTIGHFLWQPFTLLDVRY